MENEIQKQESWYQTLTFKMVVLAIMGLFLLIPLFMIRNVIKERSRYAEETKIEIGKSWALSQTITGPVLNVPGMKIVSEKGDYKTTTMHIMPEHLVINGTMNPEIRYRSIYETVVYTSHFTFTGDFTIKGYEHLDDYDYDWSRAYLSFGVTDNKGISDSVVLVLDDMRLEADPGVGNDDIYEGGISFSLESCGIDPETFTGRFTLAMDLRGSESIRFSPVGKTTDVMLSSDWVSPSFKGEFLPVDREITDEGFSAAWVVTHLNRNFPQAWTGGGYSPEDDAFGVDLMMEVDHYTKAERSAKYGLLFILFTFFVLLLVEFRSSERIHIFYYLLVAFALILFFSLLSALSEHIGFNMAYLVSSVAIIGLLSAFFRTLTGKRWVVLLISGLLTTLYLFIFILLALKDYAYLGGNIGLFIILAVLMMVSSRYRLFSERKG